MMGLANTLGLGVVLTWKDQASAGMDSASRSLKQLHGTSARTAAALVKDTERIRASMDRARAGMRTGMKLMGAGVMIAAPLALAAKKSIDFQDQMLNVKSILVGTGMAEEEAAVRIKALGQNIRDFAGQTRVAFQDLMAAAYPMVSALGIEQGSAALRYAADLSVAGMGQMSEGVQTLTSVLETFGVRWGDTMTPVEKSKKVFNTVSGAIAAFNTDLSKLSAGMVYATPQASVLGMSLAETAAAIGMLQTKGLKDAMAGTAMAAGLRGLTQLSVKFGDEAEKTRVKAMKLGDYVTYMSEAQAAGKITSKLNAAGPLSGLEIMDPSGYMLPLWQIIQNMEQVLGITAEEAAEGLRKVSEGGLTGAEAFQAYGLSLDKAGDMQKVLGDESSKMFSLLLSQSKKLKELTEQIENSNAGTVMLTERQSSVKAQFDMTKNKASALAGELADNLLPEIELLNKGLRDLLDMMGAYAEEHPTVGKWMGLGGLAASIGSEIGGWALYIYWGLKMMRYQKQIAAGVTGVAIKAGLFTRALLGLKDIVLAVFGRGGLIIGGILGLAYALGWLYDNWEWFRNQVNAAKGWIDEVFASPVGRLLTYQNPVLIMIRQWMKLGEVVKGVLDFLEGPKGTAESRAEDALRKSLLAEVAQYGYGETIRRCTESLAGLQAGIAGMGGISLRLPVLPDLTPDVSRVRVQEPEPLPPPPTMGQRSIIKHEYNFSFPKGADPAANFRYFKKQLKEQERRSTDGQR